MVLIVSQIIGICAVGLYLLSYQLKKRSHIVWVTCISNALYVLQYILLGAFSGAIMDTLSMAGSFLAGKKNSPRLSAYTKWLAAVSLAVITVTGIVIAVVQRDPVELIPILGAVFQTGGLWCEDEQKIRRYGLCSAPFWLVYNFLSQAYGAAFGSVLAIVSASTALIRYRKAKLTYKENTYEDFN